MLGAARDSKRYRKKRPWLKTPCVFAVKFLHLGSWLKNFDNPIKDTIINAICQVLNS
jgi:hypothetical protein